MSQQAPITTAYIAELFQNPPSHDPTPVRSRDHFLSVLGSHIQTLSRYEEGWIQFAHDFPNDNIVLTYASPFYIELQRRPVVCEIGRILKFFIDTWQSHEDFNEIVEPIYNTYTETTNITPQQAQQLEQLAEHYLPLEFNNNAEESEY